MRIRDYIFNGILSFITIELVNLVNFLVIHNDSLTGSHLGIMFLLMWIILNQALTSFELDCGVEEDE